MFYTGFQWRGEMKKCGVLLGKNYRIWLPGNLLRWHYPQEMGLELKCLQYLTITLYDYDYDLILGQNSRADRRPRCIQVYKYKINSNCVINYIIVKRLFVNFSVDTS